MAIYRYDLMEFGVIAKNDRVLYKDKLFIVSALEIYDGLSSCYKGLISHEKCKSISITNMKDGTIIFEGKLEIKEFLSWAKKVNNKKIDIINKLYNGEEVIVLFVSDRHSIVTNKNGQFIVESVDLKEIEEKDFRARFFIDYFSCESNPIYEILDIYN